MNQDLNAQQLAELLTPLKPRKDEEQVQAAIGTKLAAHQIDFTREYRLDAKNRLDFYLEQGGKRIAIEVKSHRASGPETERQLLRYALTGKLDVIILVVTKPFPYNLDVIKCGSRFIPVHVVNLSMNFL